MKMISVLLLTALAAFDLGCGYGSTATTPAAAGVTPAITQLMPNTTNSGSPAFTLTVNGSNFSSASVINWNTTAMTTTFVTANQLTAAIPGSALTTPGMVSVSVTNPGVAGGIYGGGTLAETSNNVTFTIN
jgi:hypothetical protein